MAEPVHDVSSIAEVADVVAGGAPGAPHSFRLRRRASLNACLKLKARARPGNSIHLLVNAELLDCKIYAREKIAEGFELLIRDVTRHATLQIEDAEECSNKLNRLLNTPEDRMPRRGPVMENRGKGLATFIYLDGPDPAVEATRNEERRHDRAAQRAVWRVCLAAQQLRKNLFMEYRAKLEAGFRDMMTSTLEQPSDLGSGYADNRFLRSALQEDFNHNYPNA